MREIALHLLDIAENSVAAESKNISVHVHEDLSHDRLSAWVGQLLPNSFCARLEVTRSAGGHYGARA